MSGVSTGTLLLAGATTAASIYVANRQVKGQKEIANQQIQQANDQAALEEERVRKQMEQQAAAAAAAAAAQSRQAAAAQEAARRAEANEKARAAADTASREAARQSEAARSQVDVAGVTDDGSRGKRRKRFFNTADNVAGGSAGGGFRV